MTTPMASGMAWPMAYPIGVAECYGTERDGTERKNLQDPIENSRFSYPPNPVDNSDSEVRND